MKKLYKFLGLFVLITSSILCFSFASGAAWAFGDKETGVVVIKGGGDGVVWSDTIYDPYNEDNLASSMTIKHLILEEGVTRIDDYAFSYLKDLETVSLPETLTAIYSGAFKGCSSLKNFILPSSVTILAADAFEGCTSLTKVYYEGEKNFDLPGHAAVPDKIRRFNVYPNETGVTLEWAESWHADYYRIYRWDYSKKQWTKITDTEGDYIDDINSFVYEYKCKTVPGEKYRFAVRPVNVNGNETKWNDFTAAESVYMIPLQLKATALQGGYKLTWNKIPGAMGYQIWYTTIEHGAMKRYKNAYTESFTKTGLKKGTTYYFQVRPVAELSNGTYQPGKYSKTVKVTVK